MEYAASRDDRHVFPQRTRPRHVNAPKRVGRASVVRASPLALLWTPGTPRTAGCLPPQPRPSDFAGAGSPELPANAA
jgi:hypothetical protein